MQALKILVAVMGLMIVAGFTVIAVTIFQRATAPDTEATVGPANAPVATGGAFGKVELALPAGASVVDSTIEDGRLLVRLRLADGATRLMILDLADGGLLGTVDLRPGAPE